MINTFRLYLIRRGIAESTIEKHFIALKTISPTGATLTKDGCEGRLLDLRSKGISSAHLNNLVVTMHHYGKCFSIPELASIKFFPVEENDKATMSDQEIEEFLALPCPPKADPTRYAIYTLFYRTLAHSGMRPNEAATLKFDTVDLPRRVFILKRTKTHPRLVPIALGLLQPLKTHIKTLSGEYLFTDKSGKPISRYMWRDEFDARIKRLGIKRTGLSTYSLRHSFITRLLDEDVNLFKVQKIVGHRQIETTAHYTHLTTKDIVRTIQKDPLNRKGASLQTLVKDAVDALASFGLQLIECRELTNGNYRIEVCLSTRNEV